MDLIAINSGELTKSQSDQIWQILVDGDSEFIPALSARESTTQTNLIGGEVVTSSGPKAYFDVLLKQAFILAIENEKVIGFISYIPDKSMKELISDCDKHVAYVSTILVNPDYRGQGIAKRLYEKLIDVCGDKAIATRTWSTNHSHITILSKLSFQLVQTIANDRGPGIDTVYYMRNI